MDTLTEEQETRKKREELQAKLQEAIRRYASATEVRQIEQKIQEANQKLEAFSQRSKTG